MVRIIYAVAGEGFGHSSRSHQTGQRFLDELDKPATKDERILWPDDERFFEILQTELNKLDTPMNIGLSE